MTFREWLNMGGFALYVWGAFGMTAFCMILEPILLRSSAKAARRRIARMNRVESEK